MEIKIKSLQGKKPRLPEYQTCGSAGADLFACVENPVIILPGETTAVPTGFSVAIPEGYEGQVRPRSGLALTHNIGLMNSPGTIDCDYRGEVKALMTNFGKEPYVIKDGDRIAQLVICPVVKAEFRMVMELDATDRGAGGFGHTGK